MHVFTIIIVSCIKIYHTRYASLCTELEPLPLQEKDKKFMLPVDNLKVKDMESTGFISKNPTFALFSTTSRYFLDDLHLIGACVSHDLPPTCHYALIAHQACLRIPFAYFNTLSLYFGYCVDFSCCNTIFNSSNIAFESFDLQLHIHVHCKVETVA